MNDGERTPGVGLVIIGDELLSGKRTDKHMPKVIELLGQRGMELAWARLVGDEPQLLEQTFRQTLAGPDIVFSFGGIGATPDDRTRQCVAAAAGVELEVHAQARAILEERFGDTLYPQRIHMIEWPQGAQVIPNPVNQVPGFSFGDHHFVPGFPNMAWPMVAWVLDHHYRHLQRDEPSVEYLLEALDTPESAVVNLMAEVMDAHPGVKIASLPEAGERRAIEFGVRGAPAAAQAAFEALKNALTRAGVPLGESSTRTP